MVAFSKDKYRNLKGGQVVVILALSVPPHWDLDFDRTGEAIY